MSNGAESSVRDLMGRSVETLPHDIRDLVVALMIGPPIARHSIASCVMSLDDDPAQPSGRLLSLAAELAARCLQVRHSLLDSRPDLGARWYRVFPGEHYRLLTALCQTLKPAVAFEFGTDTGMGTLAMREGMDSAVRHSGAKLYTVDVVPWKEKRATWLKSEDFGAGLEQIVMDMASDEFFATHGDNLRDAEFIFIDGPKDGITEKTFIEKLSKVAFRRPPIVLFDDVRMPIMLRIWRGLRYPKMDLSSFGHWSGSGLVDWGN